MSRVPLVFIALLGLFGVLANRKVAESSMRASRNVFGREIREHSASFTAARVMAVVFGSLVFVLGLLGALGVIYD